MSISGQRNLQKQVCEALGLKNVVELHLHFSVNAITTAEVKFYPETEDGNKLPAVFKKYMLVERQT